MKAADLAYWDEAGNAWNLEPDRVQLAVGASSVDLRLRDTIQVTK